MDRVVAIGVATAFGPMGARVDLHEPGRAGA